MVDIKLHIPIGEHSNDWFAQFGEEDVVFSLETVQRLFAQNEGETDFRFNIHCDGGSVYEGLAIYDALRTSGKNIFMNIEGNCHSMAMVLLLAAPFENRTANANARALIHEVQVPVDDYYLSTTQLSELANEAWREQNAIVDIYADRTGTDRAVLEQLMAEQKVRTASELLHYGFISKINSYNTNKISKSMETKLFSALTKRVDDLAQELRNLIKRPQNYDFTDSEGNIILSTERDDVTIEVGDVAVLPNGATAGEVTLADGRIIVVTDGKVAEVREAVTVPVEPAPTNQETADEDKDVTIAQLEAKILALQEENAQLRAALETAEAAMVDLKNHIKSDYRPENRQVTPRVEPRLTAEQITEMARARKRKI